MIMKIVPIELEILREISVLVQIRNFHICPDFNKNLFKLYGFNIVDVDKKQILVILKEFFTKYDDFDTFCYLINGQVTFVQRKSKIIKYVLVE